MSAYVVEWLGLLGRWLHMIVGIAWIGSSFYFVWLDNHLQPPKAHADADKGVGGELWSVHGGGFYHAQKYRVAPGTLPQTLHWFKWEAYSTWLSGMFLLILIYWYGAELYLLDASVASLSKAAGIAIGAGTIAGGWLAYDLLCRSPLGRREGLLAGVLLALLTLAAWALCQLFSGRGAYIHFGAMLGTIMVANVFFVIIPGQKRMVAAAAAGAPVDPADGVRAKQRSVHNTYFTLPVLFVMISNHYAMTYAHAYNWLILIAISVAGALIRVWFVARHSGRPPAWPLAAAAALLVAVAIAVAPRQQILTPSAAAASYQFADIRGIVLSRCTSCHAQVPSQPGFTAAPAGVVLESDADILRQADTIHQQSVVSRSMPIANLTGMRDDERALLGQWYRDGARPDWQWSAAP